MRRFVFRSPRLGFLAVGPALARPTAAFYRRNRAAFAPFDPVQPEDFFTEEGQAERLAEELGWAETGRSFRFLLVQPRHPGKIIGALGFNEIVRGAFQSCFVSYKIDAALWGRGYGSEAIRYGTGWAFRVLGLHRAEANVMPRNAASLRAGNRAEQKGYTQVLWLDGVHRKYIEEVGAMNVMFKVNGKILTPDLNGSVLDGITRRSCIQLLKDWGYEVEERRISAEELFEAAEKGELEEAWGTGTAAVISPIGEMGWKDKHVVVNGGEIGSLTQKLYDTLTGIQWGVEPDPYGWTVKL